MSELRKIPNVGKTTEKDLIAMGYTTIESLKGKTAEQLTKKNVLYGEKSSPAVSCIYIEPSIISSIPISPIYPNALGGIGKMSL